MEDSPRLPLRDPLHRRLQIPPEHQDVIRLCPVLRGLLPAGYDELLCARAQGVLHDHPMSAVLPIVQPLSYPPSDGVGCSDMSGSLQDHSL